MSKPSRLQDPEFCDLVAQMFVEGTTRVEMARRLDAHRDTVTEWVKDPRVQKFITVRNRARANRITRRIDGEIEARLSPERLRDMPLRELVALKREYRDRAGQQGPSDQDVTGAELDAWSQADDDAELTPEDLKKLGR